MIHEDPHPVLGTFRGATDPCRVSVQRCVRRAHVIRISNVQYINRGCIVWGLQRNRSRHTQLETKGYPRYTMNTVGSRRISVYLSSHKIINASLFSSIAQRWCRGHLGPHLGPIVPRNSGSGRMIQGCLPLPIGLHRKTSTMVSVAVIRRRWSTRKRISIAPW